MKNWPTALLLSFLWLCLLPSQADPPKEEVTIADDEWVEVPLDFTFPFYGNTYVTSFMFANGVIGFLDPLNIPGTGIQNDGLCCNSYDFTTTAYGDMGATYGGDYDGVRFDYVIMPWHTDLIDIGTGKFYIQGDDTFQSYFWENISEYYDQTDLNTFDTTIYPLGNIRFSYQAVDVQSHSVTVAIVGDLSAGEYNQWFYNNPSTDGGVYWTSGDTVPVEIEAGQSICEVDSTASYVCLYYAVGYAEAVYAAGCAASALYDSGCAGYAAAYLAQQCGISTLYNSACPGYATAYFNQQCSLSALYDPTCSGYETAYIDNQCTLDPLYSVSCPGYSLAAAEEEAEEDSSENEEYEDEWEEYAIFEPDTSFDTYDDFEIFDSNDFSMPTEDYDNVGFEPEFEEFNTSFEEVFAELEMEMMEVFEDFSMDMFEETFEEMEFDMPSMEDFEEMEIPEMEMPEMEEMSEPEMEMPEMEPEPEEVLDEPEMEETMEEPVEETEAEPEPEEETMEEEVLDEPVEEEEPEESEDTESEESTEDEEESADDEPEEEEVEEEIEEEVEEEEEESEETMVAESEEEEPEEELIAEAEVEEPTPAEKKKAKEKKMREIITAKLNSLAKEMGEAASLAEQQELQNFIIALLNFNLGFNSYNSSMIDGLFYIDRDIYLNMKVPENQRGLRNGLANEILHNKLVDIQYEENYGRSRI